MSTNKAHHDAINAGWIAPNEARVKEDFEHEPPLERPGMVRLPPPQSAEQLGARRLMKLTQLLLFIVKATAVVVLFAIGLFILGCWAVAPFLIETYTGVRVSSLWMIWSFFWLVVYIIAFIGWMEMEW